MLLRRQPRRPLSGALFEAQRHMASGGHSEWAKYVQDWDHDRSTVPGSDPAAAAA
jgi:hypothetical protein